jgi:lactoylglutathione lyase
MHITHVAVWTQNLKELGEFYQTYFQASAGPKYVNSAKQFESCFLTFASGARLELMRMPTVSERPDGEERLFAGYTHLAFSVGSKKQVDALTARLQRDGYRVLDGPRWTGDGYYESRVLDCDGNPIEITI